MRMSEKCRNNNINNSDNPLTFRRTDGGKNAPLTVNHYKTYLKEDSFLKHTRRKIERKTLRSFGVKWNGISPDQIFYPRMSNVANI